MAEIMTRKIVLADGSEYVGEGFGCGEDRVCEIVFNTSMAGYQEILSDPSYTCQMVVMTYPLIDNYGMAAEDYETPVPTIGALAVRHYNDRPSNFRSRKTLGAVMERYGIPGIQGIDTRALTRSIRDRGSRKALITDAATPLEKALEILETTDVPRDVVPRVSCKSPWRSEAEHARFHVAAIDCGIKHNIIRSLNRWDCDVTVLPYNVGAQQVLALQPDGLFLSNGPGDPEDVPEVMETVQALRGRLPIFGICLGHQIISLAYGARTYKLKFGHRGGNHPVRDLTTGRVEITSQNHSYAVEEESLAGTGLELTHVNLLDGTVEGVRCLRDRVFSVQYHPESAPGPQDSGHLFDRFLAMMEEGKAHA